jgi:prepilin-type N-terminal cleavage/methylation domain-containing protein
MLSMACAAPRARSQRGLSLIELMVGVAIGLIIVAGAATVAATQLADTRRLALDAQLQQDLRATSEVIAHQLRRAGYWPDSGKIIWSPSAPAVLNPSPSASAVSATQLTLAAVGNPQVSGFFLDPGPPGVVKTTFAGAGAPTQPLTDSSVESIAQPPGSASSAPAFNVQMAPIAQVKLSCPAMCADGTTDCWPTLQPKEVNLTITGYSISDPKVVRTMQTTVRVRNDQLANNNPIPGGPLCPPLP